MAKTETENQELVHTLTIEAISEGTLDITDEVISEDYVLFNSMTPEPYYGPDGFKDTMSKFLTAFPNMEYTVGHAIAEDKKVVFRNRVTEIHDVEFIGDRSDREGVRDATDHHYPDQRGADRRDLRPQRHAWPFAATQIWGRA